MSATLDSIDAKLTVAAPHLRDPCQHDAALYVCDTLLDVRNVAVLESWLDLPCPSPPT